EVVLDWKPFQYMTAKQVLGPDRYFIATNVLTPLPDGRGTHVHVTMSGHMGKLPRLLSRTVTRVMLNIVKYPQIYDSLKEVLAREFPAPAPVETAAAAP